MDDSLESRGNRAIGQTPIRIQHHRPTGFAHFPHIILQRQLSQKGNRVTQGISQLVAHPLTAALTENT